MKNSLPGDGENDDESYDTFRNMAVVPSVGLFPNFLFFWLALVAIATGGCCCCDCGRPEEEERRTFLFVHVLR